MSDVPWKRVRLRMIGQAVVVALPTCNLSCFCIYIYHISQIKWNKYLELTHALHTLQSLWKCPENFQRISRVERSRFVQWWPQNDSSFYINKIVKNIFKLVNVSNDIFKVFQIKRKWSPSYLSSHERPGLGRVTNTTIRSTDVTKNAIHAVVAYYITLI